MISGTNASTSAEPPRRRRLDSLRARTVPAVSGRISFTALHSGRDIRLGVVRSADASLSPIVLCAKILCDEQGFGRPRQDDLLAYLSGLDEALTADEMDTLQIRLEPPAG